MIIIVIGIEAGPELEVGQGPEAGLEAGQAVEVPHHLGGIEEEEAGREITGEEAETEEEQETRVGVEVEAEAEAEKEQEIKTEAGHVTGEGGTGAGQVVGEEATQLHHT